MTDQEKIIYELDLENIKMKEMIKSLRKELVEAKRIIMTLGNTIQEMTRR